MNWILDHLQIVLLVLMGLGSFVIRRIQQRQEERAEPPPSAEDYDPDFEFEEGEEGDSSYRKMDRRAWQPTVPPPLPTAPGAQDAELLRQRAMMERLQALRETKTLTAGNAAVTQARVRDRQSKRAAVVGSPELKRRLRNREELRQAIITREILGPPVGLR